MPDPPSEAFICPGSLGQGETLGGLPLRCPLSPPSFLFHSMLGFLSVTYTVLVFLKAQIL